VTPDQDYNPNFKLPDLSEISDPFLQTMAAIIAYCHPMGRLTKNSGAIWIGSNLSIHADGPHWTLKPLRALTVIHDPPGNRDYGSYHCSMVVYDCTKAGKIKSIALSPEDDGRSSFFLSVALNDTYKLLKQIGELHASGRSLA
jgi:hypothetical protein